MSEKIEVEKEESDSLSSVYEVGYIMVPTIAEENLGAEVISLKDSLLEKGVVFVSEEYPKLMELAYEMVCSIANKKQKFSSGYFGWLKFECEAGQTKGIKKLLDSNEKLVRFLFIKTVRENTMSTKRFYNRQEGTKRHFTPKVEETVPINEETLDKEIEALVAE
jgi:ribosomal protein S6